MQYLQICYQNWNYFHQFPLIPNMAHRHYLIKLVFMFPFLLLSRYSPFIPFPLPAVECKQYNATQSLSLETSWSGGKKLAKTYWMLLFTSQVFHSRCREILCFVDCSVHFKFVDTDFHFHLFAILVADEVEASKFHACPIWFFWNVQDGGRTNFGVGEELQVKCTRINDQGIPVFSMLEIDWVFQSIIDLLAKMCIISYSMPLES